MAPAAIKAANEMESH